MSEHSLIGCGKCSKFKHHCSFTLVVCTSVDQAKVSHLLSFNRFIMNPHYLKALSWLEVFAVSWVCELNAYQISKCFGHFFYQIRSWSCLLLGNLPWSGVERGIQISFSCNFYCATDSMTDCHFLF